MLRVTIATSLSPAQLLTLETQPKERPQKLFTSASPVLHIHVVLSTKNHEEFEKARKSKNHEEFEKARKSNTSPPSEKKITHKKPPKSKTAIIRTQHRYDISDREF